MRFALFAILMVTVGLSAFNLYAVDKTGRDNNVAINARSCFWSLTMPGVIAAVIGTLAMAAAMDGTSILSVRTDMFWMLVSETEIGAAAIVRIFALTLALLLCLPKKPEPTILSAGVGLLSSIALASLVWTGHAGATEGGIGLVHRVSDIIHMIAAALWLGGLAGFAILLRPITPGVARLETAHRALDLFAKIGTICVALIILTGLINSFIIIGPDGISQLFSTTYGQLLFAKLGLVGLMLALAAYNRWRLTPRLGIEIESGTTVASVAALRQSIAIEGSAGLLILGLVAWLGMLEPPTPIP